MKIHSELVNRVFQHSPNIHNHYLFCWFFVAAFRYFRILEYKGVGEDIRLAMSKQ